MRNWLQLSSIVGRRVADGDQQKGQQSSSSSSRAPSLEPAPGVCCKPPAPRQVRRVTAMQVLARGPHVPSALFQPVLLASHLALNKLLEEPHSSHILSTSSLQSQVAKHLVAEAAACGAHSSRCVLPSCPLFCQAVRSLFRQAVLCSAKLSEPPVMQERPVVVAEFRGGQRRRAGGQGACACPCRIRSRSPFRPRFPAATARPGEAVCGEARQPCADLQLIKPIPWLCL